MKKDYFIIPLILAILTLAAAGAEGSWLIDRTRFHASAHGRLSCFDCHEDMSDAALHPDPSAVNRKTIDFFDPEQCLSCHDQVMTDIEEGVHGGATAGNPDEFKACLNCHAPHYQILSGSGLDPAKPVDRQCGLCHEEQKQLPPPSPDAKECYGCHRQLDRTDPQYTGQTNHLCFHCHQGPAREGSADAAVFPLVKADDFIRTPHGNMACLDCHRQAAAFEHGSQKTADCQACHLRHDEKKAHEAHMGVTCQACHIKAMDPVRNPETGLISGKINLPAGDFSRIHDLVDDDDEQSCRRCHFQDNKLGAAGMVLPAKSMLCMPCHTATFSLGDTVTIVSLLIFILGLAASVSVWLTGTLDGNNSATAGEKIKYIASAVVKTVFSNQIGIILKSLLLDVFLQRRLFKQSRIRWGFHALIFFPFILRFIYGLVALIASLAWPEWSGTWVMIDKNSPLTALFFDLTGLLIIMGVVLLIWGRKIYGPKNMSGLPGTDWAAAWLWGGIILSGFVVEGFRLAMTGHPAGSGYAFVGRAFSSFVEGSTGLTSIYGYIWYLHAVLVGALVALLPFSRMFHIIMTPVVLLVNAACSKEQESDRSNH